MKVRCISSLLKIEKFFSKSTQSHIKMSKQEKEPIIVEKEEDNVEIDDDDSSDEGQSWAEVSKSASQQVQRIVQTPPNEPNDTRGRQTTPVRGGRGGFRGRGRGAPAHTGPGRTYDAQQSVIDSLNKIITGLNAKVKDQAQELEKFRVNYAALQTKYFDTKQEKDDLQTEKEARARQKEARLTQKTREVVQKAPDVKK